MPENIHESKNYENFKQGLYAKNMTTWTNLYNTQQAQVDTDKFMKIKFFLAEMKVNFGLCIERKKAVKSPPQSYSTSLYNRPNKCSLLSKLD